MIIRIEQLNPTIGAFTSNKEKILKAISRATDAGVDMLLLPELATCGYPPMDLLERKDVRETLFEVNKELISAIGKTAVVFGSVTENPVACGRKLFNSAIVAQNGKEITRVHKTLLPTYDVFDDLRYFEPNTVFSPVKICGFPFGITICEDIWYNENEIQYHTYPVNPAEELVKLGAKAIINISGSPFTRNKAARRRQMLQKHAQLLNVPLFYSNQLGAHTEIIFDGDSLAINTNGDIVQGIDGFREGFFDVELDTQTNQVFAGTPNFGILSIQKTTQQRQFEALCFGLAEYFKKTGIPPKVLLGLSGGIDSALTCALAVEALGSDNVMCVGMPSRFSSSGSIKDSEKLAQNLGVSFRVLPIHALHEQFESELFPYFEGTNPNMAEENIQSRIRGTILMALSNKFGHLLLSTGNKSEMAVGYCTLYGDMNGALNPIGDLYKTEVYELCRWLNKDYYQKEVIPNEILEKVPSAELRPGQKDSDLLPDYAELDAILYAFIEEQKSPAEVEKMGYSSQTVQHVIRLILHSEYKRYQSAPVLKLSQKAFGTGRRWPVVQGFGSEIFENCCINSKPV